MKIQCKIALAITSVTIMACGEPDVSYTDRAQASPAPGAICDYPQAFGNAPHAGLACPSIDGMRVAAAIVQDPDVVEENTQTGFLSIHESAPLTLGDYVVVPSKRGFTSVSDDNGFRPPTETWFSAIYRWSPNVSAPSAALLHVADADTDWQPVDVIMGSFGSYTNGYVQGFFPAIVGSTIAVPAKFGRMNRVSLATGTVISTVDPFAGTAFSGDPTVIDVSGISVAKDGSVLYTVTAFPNAPGTDRSDDPRSSWLVRVKPDNSTQIVEWRALASTSIGVPGRDDACEYPFGTNGTPGPTGPNSRPPLFGCGFQRPGFNAPPAIDDDGTIFVWSYANNAQGAAFIVALDGATLVPLRAMDTRGRLRHGCGVRLSATSGTCAVLTNGGTTNLGVDPNFNGSPRFRGEDLMDSAVSINGNFVCIGSYDGGVSFGGGYDARGALVCFNKRTGAFATTNEEFGWEVTASGTSPLYQDRNLYSELDLGVATYALSFAPLAIGTVPVDFTANAVDFLDANIVHDAIGAFYGVNGNGHAYQFGADGSVLASVPLPGDDGAPVSMETLSGYWARDRAGRAYVSYAGRVYVLAGGVGSTSATRTLVRPIQEQAAALRAGMAAKAMRAATSELPTPPM